MKMFLERFCSGHKIIHAVLSNDSSAIDDEHALANHRNLRQDMRAQKDRVLVSKGFDHPPNLDDLLRVESYGGFVENEHWRIPNQGLSEADRCRYPFDRLPVRRFAMAVRPQRSMTLSTSCFRRDRGTPLTSATYPRKPATSISGYRGTLSGMYPTRRFTSMGSFVMSNPATVAVPRVGGEKPVRIRIVVVFPAAFGPRIP